MDFTDTIKTLLLAGVGAVVKTAEVTTTVVGELVKQGEITLAQGKELTADLGEEFKTRAAEHRRDAVFCAVERMTPAERAALRTRLEDIEAEPQPEAEPEEEPQTEPEPENEPEQMNPTEPTEPAEPADSEDDAEPEDRPEL